MPRWDTELYLPLVVGLLVGWVCFSLYLLVALQ